ncbi:Cyclic di-GMP phosphodiesterase Gmr [compost metagenome]
MRLPIRLGEGQSIVTSLSVGIAYFPDDGQTPSDLLNAADAAMYQAKRNTRGQWQAAETESSANHVKNRS